jgi:hypothetical protein
MVQFLTITLQALKGLNRILWDRSPIEEMVDAHKAHILANYLLWTKH